MGQKMQSEPQAAVMPEIYTAEDLNRWADRFWDPIFKSKGIVPDADDREASRGLTARALLLMANEAPGQPFTASDLAKAIHRVSQDPLLA